MEHILSFLSFVWVLQNALLVYLCEMAIDIIKHSFVAKFNDIKPIAFSEFLEDLCKQVFLCPQYVTICCVLFALVFFSDFLLNL